LPRAKIDEAAIIAQIALVDKLNEQAREIDQAKRLAEEKLKGFENELTKLYSERQTAQDRIHHLTRELEKLQKSVAVFDEKVQNCQQVIDAAAATIKDMPSGEYANATQLTEELQQAQIINREINRRSKRDILQGQLNAHRERAAQLSRQMEQRTAEKNTAIGKAAMPVEGLTFDENEVLHEGIPLDQLGDAEKIRISTAIAMAANPKLRVIRIMHGESLDEDGLAILAKMAEEHDFQIWMARVDSSGKVGIIMEDGSVKAHAEAE
jgi:predicted  nucleic acid-binding Zn-ribbon protein